MQHGLPPFLSWKTRLESLVKNCGVPSLPPLHNLVRVMQAVVHGAVPTEVDDPPPEEVNSLPAAVETVKGLFHAFSMFPHLEIQLLAMR